MAGKFTELFAKFDKLPEAKRREFDNVLAFLETARMPTEQGARNRGILQTQPLDPNNVRLMGAYAAYRYKLNHQPMDTQKRKLAQLAGVPEDEIAKQDSVEKWEADQFGRFDKLMQLVKPPEMQPEVITGNVPKKKPAKPKPMPATAPKAATTGEQPSSGAPPATPSSAPAAAPQPVSEQSVVDAHQRDLLEQAVRKIEADRAQKLQMLGGAVDNINRQRETNLSHLGDALGQPAMIAAPPPGMAPPTPIGQLEERYMPLGAQLGGELA